MDRKVSAGLLAGMLLLSATAGWAQFAPAAEATASLAGIRTVRVTVSESYGQVKKVDCPFLESCRKFFSFAGVNVVTAEPCDAVLAITARGEPIAASYDSGRRAYSGATVSGTLTLSANGRTLHSRSFLGRTEPPQAIWEGWYETPDRAPFRSAYEDGFLPALGGLVRALGGIPALAAALKDGGIGIDQAAARVLGATGDPEAIAPLLSVVRKEPICFAATDALVALGRPAAGTIAALLEDRDGQVRYRVASALRQARWQAPDRAQQAAYWVNLGEWAKAAELGAAAVRPLLVELTDPRGNEDFPTSALAKIGAPAFDPLMEALKSDVPRLRRLAARALGLMKDARATDALLALLDDGNAYVRGSAAVALGSLGAANAVEPILRLARQKEPDASVRAAYITALGKLNDPRAAAVIQAATKDGAHAVRAAAAEALRKR